MNRNPTEQELNAYVDGELAPSDRARIARAVAEDPAVAARVALLSRLKMFLSEAAGPVPKSVELPRPRWSAGALAIAASIGLMVAVAVGTWDGFLQSDPVAKSWFSEARAEHQSWAFQPAAPDARPVEANLFLAGLERIGLPVQTPDLSSARLRLTYMHYYEPTEARPAALHLGYTGHRGCKVTLWATRAPADLGTALVETRVDALRGYQWRSGPVAYALFATGMAERRFSVIAEKVYAATREQRGFDENTRVALSSASAGVPPCMT